MPPPGLAILIGAGPNTESPGSSPTPPMATSLSPSSPAGPNPSTRSSPRSAEAAPMRFSRPFPTDTSKESLEKTFKAIREHWNLEGPNIKLSSKKPFLEETHEDFTESLEQYVGGAFTFAQESLKRFFADPVEAGLGNSTLKKGTLIFTGTLGALRCNAQFTAYGAGRSSVRQLARTLACKMSGKGVHVVHTIVNDAIVDADGEDQKNGKKMSADAAGETCLWTHELDMRPTCEKF
ncbi:hypothetical protein CC80DRAFT_542161 [Byssothecium circinans]|uniref:NAD(P)-binding protein n=1 Tax=Byssothecium circinans TaxID=147558 RepID=A0A6A5UFB4_9PLEO|nr:hypothetical protein CC80DRAFT_542161 [Byssothecium circinans]